MAKGLVGDKWLVRSPPHICQELILLRATPMHMVNFSVFLAKVFAVFPAIVRQQA